MGYSKFALIGVTLFAFTIAVTIAVNQFPPDIPVVESIPDDDMDGFPNNVDFYDHGDGGIRVEISDFRGTCNNWFWQPCEPKVRLRIDTDGDGSFETKTERALGKTDHAENVIKHTVNLPEDRRKVSFIVGVWDLNHIWGTEYIDYTEGTGRYGKFEFDLSEGSRQWNKRGYDVPYCSLTMKVDVVGM